MRIEIDPLRLRVNRSAFTLDMQMAGLPLAEMWTHMLAAENYADRKRKLPSGSGYDELCSASTKGGDAHKGGKALFSVLNSVRKSGVRDAISVYSLGRGEYEVYGGHHRAIAAMLAGKTLPAVVRSLDPMTRVAPKQLAQVERAYKVVESKEKLTKGKSYNPMPGRKAVRPSPIRLRMMYRAIIDVPGASLLDAGCNDGYFGVALSDHAFVPTFVDQSAAYCDVVRAKLRALKMSAGIVRCTTIQKAPAGMYDVVLYTDVFYHAATKQSLDVAMVDWHKLMDSTRHRMIFCPGRWDKLAKVGFTERMMWTHARSGGFRIRYIGRDMDPGYERPMFCLERTKP